MASLALGAVGSVAGAALGPVGSMIGQTVGVAAGAYIDGKYLIPALFPPEEQEVPNLGDVSPQGHEEGREIPLCLGPQNRVQGHIIWMSEVEDASGGGKGSTDSLSSQQEFRRSFAVLWCWDREVIVDGVEEIWAYGDLIYREQENISVASSQLTVAIQTNKVWPPGDPFGTPTTDETYMDIESPAGGPDLSVFRSGVDVSVNGFPAVGNNGIFRVLAAEKNTATGETFLRCRNSGASAMPATTGEQKTLLQVRPKFAGDFADSFTNYLGGGEQLPDPVIQQHEGASEVPGHRGSCMTVIERYNLNQNANSIPQFTAKIRAHKTLPLAQAISVLCRRAGMTSEHLDVSSVTGNVIGYQVPGAMKLGRALTPMLMANDVVVRERGGKLEFGMREDVATRTVDATEVNVGEVDDQSDFPSTDRRGVLQVTGELRLRYREPELDFSFGAIDAKNRVAPPGASRRQLTIPMVMTTAQAFKVAYGILFEEVANAIKQTITLPPSFMDLSANTVLAYTLKDKPWKMMALRLGFTPEGDVEVVCGQEEVNLSDFEGYPVNPVGPPTKTRSDYVPHECFGRIMDVPAIRTGDEKAGFYWAGCAYGSADQFKNLRLIQSNQSFGNFQQVSGGGHIRAEAVCGRVMGTVPGNVAWEYWDLGNTFDVEIYNGTMASAATDEEAFPVLVGEEMMLVVNVQFLQKKGGYNQYRLSRLMRGIRGTDIFIDKHTDNERFVVLGEDRIQRHNKGAGTIGQVRDYKFVPKNGKQADYRAVRETLRGNGVRPLSPIHVEGKRDAANDLDISCQFRTNMFEWGLPGPPSGTNGSSSLFFECEIVDDHTSRAVLRTLTLSSSTGHPLPHTFATYTAAQQTADGLTPGDPVSVIVYQNEPPAGRSYPRDAIV